MNQDQPETIRPPSCPPGSITTFSGRNLCPLALRPHDIHLEDIAHALANICRFNGHTRRFYSVAEHSVHCLTYLQHERDITQPDLLAAVLFHDAAEAYICDLPRPLKDMLPGYAEAEDQVRKVIAARFGIDPELFDHPLVQEADDILLATESWQVMTNMETSQPTWARALLCWSPESAKHFFLQAVGDVVSEFQLFVPRELRK